MSTNFNLTAANIKEALLKKLRERNFTHAGHEVKTEFGRSSLQ